MKLKGILAAAGLLAVVGTSQAEAAILNLSGVTRDVNRSPALDGLSWSMTLDLNDNATDTTSSNSLGDFSGANALNSLSLTVGSDTVTAGSNGFFLRAQSAVVDGFGFSTRDFGTQTIGGFSVFELGLNVSSAISFNFSNVNDLGLTLSELVANFGVFSTPSNGSRLFLGNGNQFIQLISNNASLGPVSAVPVPAALPLLATAFAGLGFVSWRRKRTAA